MHGRTLYSPSQLAPSAAAEEQWLTLVHFSARLEQCLTHKNTLNTINTP